MTFLLVLAAMQAVAHAAVASLSADFAFGTEETGRPILLVLALFITSFLLYLWSIRVAIRCVVTWRLAAAIFVSSALFRVLLLPTPPIQEIDVYRYLWDGSVTARGINPYRYTPEYLLSAKLEAGAPDDLAALLALRDHSPSLAEALRRIHYSELSTIYPPASQAVFGIGDWITPHNASLEQRVLILKTILSIFDVGTAALVWLMLRIAGKPPGLTVAYAWCPLVIKEFANTGHLDSIAIFFTTAAVWCVVRQLAVDNSKHGKWWMLAGSLLLALAIGAKLYAVVLIPVLGAAIAAKRGIGCSARFAAVIALLSAGCLAPMLLTRPVSDAGPATSGLTAFLTRWEMNDFLFMIVVENLRPAESPTQGHPAWFVVMPETWREAVIRPLSEVTGTDLNSTAFAAARIITGCTFAAIALALAWGAYRYPESSRLLELVFLTLAWFWLLSPTQNPWYWAWALPFLPFARGRAWYAVSGLVMLYYFRFWLQYHYPEAPALGTIYGGPRLFDFVVSWFEYAPWFVWLASAAYRRRNHGAVARATSPPSSVADLTEFRRANP